MQIIIATISIFVIAGLTTLTDKILPFKVCPICAGVSGTWLWMLAVREFGYPADSAVIALLLGGSVVGIAYQLDKRLPAGRSGLACKMLFIPVGFVASYGLISSQWTIFAPAIIVLITLSCAFLWLPRIRGTKTTQNNIVHALHREALEKKMKNCC